jgi:hypothetical protein
MKFWKGGIILSFILLISSVALSQPITSLEEIEKRYDIRICIECHEDVHDEWKNSWHAKSIIDPRVLKTWRTFIIRGLDQEPQMSRKNLKEACLPCHAPQTKDITPELSEKIANMIVTAVEDGNQTKRENTKKELAKLNINCLVCHNLKATPDGKSEAKTIYGPKGPEQIDTSSHEELGFKTIKSDFLRTTEFCAQCHIPAPPGTAPGIGTFSTYKEYYLKKGGKETCHSCHMRKDEEVSHRFPGVYEGDFTSQWIDIKIEPWPASYINHMENKVIKALDLGIEVINKGAHIIPHG